MFPRKCSDYCFIFARINFCEKTCFTYFARTKFSKFCKKGTLPVALTFCMKDTLPVALTFCMKDILPVALTFRMKDTLPVALAFCMKIKKGVRKNSQRLD